MIKFLDNPWELDEHMAVDNNSCYQCDRDIDIGDVCYVDNPKGLDFDHNKEKTKERDRVKIYCKYCYDEAIDSLPVDDGSESE